MVCEFGGGPGVGWLENTGVWEVKVRSDLHLVRKAYHFFGVLVIIGLYQLLTREQGLITISIASPLVLIIDLKTASRMQKDFLRIDAVLLQRLYQKLDLIFQSQKLL